MSKTSLYYLTLSTGRFLGYYVHRSLTPQPDDLDVTVTERYVNRPNLLALDLYGDEDYFMAIALRNGFQDPIYDMTLGKKLTVPSYRYVREVFG